jgi:UDP-glucuronate 4-epimerase
MKQSVLVTGAAGFIGSSLVERLLNEKYGVIGLDNFDDYYLPGIKWNNISALKEKAEFLLIQGDIRDTGLLARIFSEHRIDKVVHLAARAGVRPSIQHPQLYEDVNVRGTINLLEASRTHDVKRFVFASSSSVYGLNDNVPFREDARVDSPASPYAASKLAAELFCRTYSHLYNLPVAALRFFTVYGPRQRPEMAIHLFTKQIENGKEISLFGDGSSKRDYTYISDIVDGIVRSMECERPGFEIYNLGDSRPIALKYLVQLIEGALNKNAMVNNMATQPGDVPITYAEVSKARDVLGYNPKVTIEEGISLFVRWYLKSGRPAECGVA